jgi:hypothetical protein
MNPRKASLALLALFSFAAAAGRPSAAQTATMHTPIAASAPTAVPALVPFNGTTLGEDARPLTGQNSITFLIFKDEQAGEPLWSESQNVAIDATGQYKVQLGATSPNGLPTELFATGEARWLEVQVAGHAPQARVLLASVPYALKAGDATTFNGLPLSAFALVGANTPQTAAALSNESTAAGATNVTTTGGAAGYLPVFTGAATITDSILYSSSTGIGVGDVPNSTAVFDVNGKSIWRGLLNVSRAGTATAATGFDSYPFLFQASSYNASTKAATLPEFQLQAEPTGNNTATPGATFNLLYNANGGVLAETGLSINPNGTINFAPGQTFPGAGGAGTITAVTAGTALTGGGTTGNVTLNVDTTKVPLLAATSNTFTGSQTIGGNFSVEGSAKITGGLSVGAAVTADQVQSLTGSFTQGLSSSGLNVPPTGTAPFAGGANSYPLDLHSSVYGYFDPAPVTTDFRLQAESSYNGYTGQDQNSLNLLFGSTSQTMAETGLSIQANGALTAPSVSAASMTVGPAAGNIISSPAMVIQADDNGVSRTAAQQLSIQGATIPGQQLLIGYISDANTNSNGGLATIQATWNGYENTALALQPNGGCVCVRTGLNGALSYQNDPFVVGQGQGIAIADGWGTYSSRRFKTNIQTLPNALEKVEKMRGVSYTLKATGRREIGVIAEEVGEVLPEVVTYEANGKDARAVDYNRLTAVLIEATKEQQKLIDKQAAQLETAIHQIKAQQAQIHRQSASLKQLRNQVQANTMQVHQISQQPTNSQPILVASR